MTPKEIEAALKAAGYTKSGDKYEKTVKGHHIEFEPQDAHVIVYIDANKDNFVRFLTTSFHPDDISWVEKELLNYMT